MPMLRPRQIKYILLMTSLIFTAGAQSGPVNRYAALDSNPMISEDRKIRITQQTKAREKQHSDKRRRGRHYDNHKQRNQFYGHQTYQDRGQQDHRQALSFRYIGEFQTRKREKESDITLEINDYISVLEIEGLGRGTVIHRAYLEMDDGRLKRLRELEGVVERRDVLKQRLGHQQYGRALHLEVSSNNRKRAYAKVNVGR